MGKKRRRILIMFLLLALELPMLTGLGPVGQIGVQTGWSSAEAASTSAKGSVLARWSKGQLEGALAYSPNGRLLALATNLGVRLDDPIAGSYVRTLETPSSVLSIAFTPSGQFLAAGLADHTVRLWRVTDGVLLHILRGHTFEVTGLAISPNGQLLASIQGDASRVSRDVWPPRVMHLWRIADGAPIHTLDHAIVSQEAISAAFTPDGKTLIIGRGNGIVQFWGLKEAKLIRTQRSSGELLALSPEGQILASTLGEGLQLWRVADGTLLRTIDMKGDFMAQVAFAPDGKMVALAFTTLLGDGRCCDRGVVKLWRVTDGALLSTLRGHMAWIGGVAFAPNGRTIATASWDQTVRLWRTLDGAALSVLAEFSGGIESVAFAPDGRTAAVGTSARGLQIRQVPNGQIKQMLGTDMTGMYAIAFSRDGQLIAGGAQDIVKLWRAKDGTPLQTLHTSLWIIWSMAFSPDGQVIAVAGETLTRRTAAEVWRISDGVRLHNFGQPWSTKSYVAFSSDGTSIIEQSSDDTQSEIGVWRTSGGVLLRKWKVNGGRLAVTPDGQTLAVMSVKAGVQLWQVKDGTLLRTLEKGLDAITLSFSTDSRMLAVGSKNGKVRIWRVSDGALLQSLTGPNHFVTGLAFAPDNRTLLMGSLNGTAWLWKIR